MFFNLIPILNAKTKDTVIISFLSVPVFPGHRILWSWTFFHVLGGNFFGAPAEIAAQAATKQQAAGAGHRRPQGLA